jgi:hypothetical protein
VRRANRQQLEQEGLTEAALDGLQGELIRILGDQVNTFNAVSAVRRDRWQQEAQSTLKQQQQQRLQGLTGDAYVRELVVQFGEAASAAEEALRELGNRQLRASAAQLRLGLQELQQQQQPGAELVQQQQQQTGEGAGHVQEQPEVLPAVNAEQQLQEQQPEVLPAVNAEQQLQEQQPEVLPAVNMELQQPSVNAEQPEEQQPEQQQPEQQQQQQQEGEEQAVTSPAPTEAFDLQQHLLSAVRDLL